MRAFLVFMPADNMQTSVAGFEPRREGYGRLAQGESGETFTRRHRGEVGGRVIGSDPALVVAEDPVHDPVQAVFNRPMTAPNRPETSRHHDP